MSFLSETKELAFRFSKFDFPKHVRHVAFLFLNVFGWTWTQKSPRSHPEMSPRNPIPKHVGTEMSQTSDAPGWSTSLAGLCLGGLFFRIAFHRMAVLCCVPFTPKRSWRRPKKNIQESANPVEPGGLPIPSKILPRLL